MISKDKEILNALQTIIKKIDMLIIMKKNERIKNAIKKEDNFFETSKESYAWLLTMLMLVIFGFKNETDENKKEEDEE